MKRFVIAAALIAGLGTLITSVARPALTAAAARTLLASVGLAPAPGTGRASSLQQSASPHTSALSRARISQVGPDRIAVTMDASGELSGALTITFDSSGGNITGGDWALVVAEIPPVADHQDGADRHGDDAAPVSEVPIQKGTLSGKVTGGTLSLGADGAVSSIDSVQLEINLGSLNFASVATGGGTAQVASVQDYPASNGSLTLSF